MIHRILLSLDQALPFYPPAVILLCGVAIVALVLLIFGRAKGAILASVAAVLVTAGLGAGLLGLGRPHALSDWDAAEDLARSVIGPPEFRNWETATTACLAVSVLFLYSVYNSAFSTRPGDRVRMQLERDARQAQALGSAHLCSPRTFRRWSRLDRLGWTLHGRFWGARGRPLGRRLCLSGEDIARGVAVFGPQGSGKTQCAILPAIADRMRDRHSLVITDVQGELQPYVERIAAITGHALYVHNPSEPDSSCAVNLCDWVDTVADARSMAMVLLSEAHGQGDAFWARAAVNLLAACALHYPNLGQVLAARDDLHAMARDLAASKAPGAAQLAADFTGSMRTQDPKLALNIMAEAFNVGLAPWADPMVRRITSRTDLDLAARLVEAPTVLILRCSRLHEEAYGPYLGTVLRVLTTRLDAIGEKAGGALPIPVGLILEEFPALGRLDSLVRDINLMRKRRISVLTAAQSLAQFDHVYPARGEADRLLAGLATKIVFGGCDGRTAEFFSQLSGQQTLTLASVSHGGHTPSDSATASLRARALLLPDDLVRPARGNATVFAAYSARGHAEQAIFHAELTPFFRRREWKLSRVQPAGPITTTRTADAPPLPQEREAPADPGPELARSLADGIVRAVHQPPAPGEAK
jgi:type IV secretory pathway TraG/TraD family ATPase VirD4